MKQMLIVGSLLLANTIIYAQSSNEIMETAKTMNQNQEKILTLHKSFYDALTLRTEKIIREGLREEFVFTSANGDILDKEKFIKGFAMNPSIKIPLLNTSNQKIVVIENTAILTGIMHINIIRDITNDNTVRDLWERITETYIRQGDQWKLLALQATYMQNK
ncbi:protein of unknown function [Chitinophaga sp. CF118]|uniref:nuclear transport factor 2 family protein n=1 Tax=Chitinophaga sp. CF118 TaxID=1884367 RepID=UPI0008E3BBC4|nr:nuclear transport factor 2 family protein [Chitinophaga sp. CF118]SFD15794.1 protein of unknown function [Chitinophaga sp. CF118]